MNPHDFSNSCMMAHPLERHPFEGPHEACAACGRLRAFHSISDFVPSTLPSSLCMDPSIHYRGRPGASDKRCGMKGSPKPRLSREEFLSRKEQAERKLGIHAGG